MHSIFLQISGLVGLLILLKELWNFEPLDRTIFFSAGTFLAVYVVLMLVDLSIRRIMTLTPERLVNQPAGTGKGIGSGPSERRTEPEKKNVSPAA